MTGMGYLALGSMVFERIGSRKLYLYVTPLSNVYPELLKPFLLPIIYKRYWRNAHIPGVI